MNNKFKQRGFGIIEVLIASTVIGVVVGVAAVSGSSSLRNAGKMQETVQATYLAQEGIELVRQIRDSYWIDQDSSTNFSNLTLGTKYPRFSDPDGKWDLAGTAADNSKVILSNTTFTRTVTIENIGTFLIPRNVSSNITDTVRSQMARRVTVKVTWPNNLTGVTISEVITDWRPNY